MCGVGGRFELGGLVGLVDVCMLGRDRRPAGAGQAYMKRTTHICSSCRWDAQAGGSAPVSALDRSESVDRKASRPHDSGSEEVSWL